MTISEGNQLIMQFDKYEPDGKKTTSRYIDIITDTDGCNNNKGKYHTSWEWLMPVVEKIGKMYHYQISENICLFFLRDKDRHKIEVVSKSTITAAWLAVIEFIKWYNSK